MISRKKEGRPVESGRTPTKRALAAALKDLMAQKPLEKITIRELTDRCGIQRQNFYYHFEDIYDLLKWMLQEEAVSLLEKREGALLWQEGLLQLFQYLQENRAVCLCALKSLGRGHLRQFFRSDAYDVIHRTILSFGEEMGGAEGDMELVTHFYVLFLTGLLESWLLGEIDRTPEELVSAVDQMLQDHLRGALARRRAGEA